MFRDHPAWWKEKHDKKDLDPGFTADVMNEGIFKVGYPTKRR